MMQPNDTEKPYLLHHLVIHGVLAVAFLMVGWLFPAQYRTLHTDTLEQAAVQEAQTLKEFRQSFTANSRRLDAGAILDIAVRQLEKPAPKPANISRLPVTPALDPYFSPSHRRATRAQLAAQGEPVRRLLALEPQATTYAPAITLAAVLQTDGQFHQDLNLQLHRLGQEGNSKELGEALHAMTLLASRLTAAQLGALMRHTESTLTLMRTAKIAKLQTLVPPFDSFNELDAEGNSDDVITADELLGTPFEHLTGTTVAHANGKPVKWDADGNGQLTRQEWVTLQFIPLEHTEFPAVYAAAVWSGQPEAVTRYLMRHGRPGTRWLQEAMGHGRGAMMEVLAQQLPVAERAGLGLDSAAAFSLRHPGWALAVKYLLLGLGCVILMRAWNSFFTVTATSANAVRDFILRRRAMACALFLTLVALGEPVFLQPAQSSEYQVSINLPVLSEDENQNPNPEPNQTMLASSTSTILNVVLALAFAAIQIMVYITCKSKIDEIRMGAGDPLLKLRLLENEDNLFDMGLYIGIAGTALTLAAKMLGFEEISLSVAYASNIFGILCVALVKIYHVRGTRQQLIMEAEAQPGTHTV